MIEIVKDKVKKKNIIKLLSEIAIPEEFPSPLLKRKDWKVLILKSWNVFEEDYYKLLQSFFLDKGDSSVLLTNADFNDLYEVLEFKNSTEYKDFFRVIHDELSFANAHNILLFDRSIRWLIYIDTLKDISLFAHNPEFNDNAIKHFYCSNYRINSIDGFRRYLYEMRSVRDTELFISESLLNYPLLEIEGK